MEDTIRTTLRPQSLSIDQTIKRLPKFFTMSIASKRNTGKTVLITAIIKRLIATKRVDMVFVMSGSAGLNDDYKFLPKKLVMPFSEDTLYKIWQSQASKEQSKRKHILIVLDDCLGDSEALRNPMIQKYYAQGRHVNTSFVVLSQHTSALLTPVIKANSDMLLWSKLNRYQLEQLWESTSNIEKKDFVALSENLASVDYQFMCLDNYVKSTNPAEFLFVTKAGM